MISTVADRHGADGARAGGGIGLPTMTTRTSWPRTTRPASGCASPARTRSRVDLPSPLRPTTPTRWPGSIPSVTESRIARVANTTVRSSIATSGGTVGKAIARPRAGRPPYRPEGQTRPSPPSPGDPTAAPPEENDVSDLLVIAPVFAERLWGGTSLRRWFGEAVPQGSSASAGPSPGWTT